MKRKQTRITVWPAIADLMTAIMVIAILSGTIVVALNYKPDEQVKTEDGVQDLKIQVDSLLASVEEKKRQVDSLQNSIQKLQDDEGKMGSPSCLGKIGKNNPYSLLTIQFNPRGYRITLNNKPQIASASGELQDYVLPYDQKTLRESEMIDFAEGLERLGREYEEGSCVFYVLVEDGGVPKDSLILNWIKLERYLRLANSSILRK